MRRFMVLPMAALLALAVAAPVAAGPNVSNQSGSGESIYGEWYDGTTYGYVFLGEEAGYGGFGDIYQESGEWVLCEPAIDETPVKGTGKPSASAVPTDTTPGEEFYGFVGTRTWGYAYDLTIEFSRRLETGRAIGTVDLFTDIVDECNGIYGGDPAFDSGPLVVELTGAGPLASFRGTGSYAIPSEFNGHYNYRGKERQATGSIDAAGVIAADFDWAYMSQTTWTEHVNS
jgi:hypothetical protein